MVGADKMEVKSGLMEFQQVDKNGCVREVDEQLIRYL